LLGDEIPGKVVMSNYSAYPTLVSAKMSKNLHQKKGELEGAMMVA